MTPEALLTLALSLTHDRNHNVRSEAGRALALVASLASTGLAATVESRLNDLLHEAGAIVPRFALLGLAESAKRGVRPPAQLLAAVSDLHNRHLAASVRWAAGHVLKVVVAEGAR